MVGFV
jgi:hypothetical protein